MEELEEVPRALIEEDLVVTPDFSIVGEILQKEFSLSSKYGELKIELGDVVLADRAVAKEVPIVRKSVTVPAMTFFQNKPKSTGIRVRKGDRILIRASGIVQWTNWNSSSSPDGVTNRNQWNGINSGTLTARIGNDNTNCIAVGSKSQIVAKANGVLFLGIAMRDSYANNVGYTWTGDYKANITVNPNSR